MFLHYKGKHEHELRQLCVLVILYNVSQKDTALACYIFDIHQPILIFL